jgi:hypothetical protein
MNSTEVFLPAAADELAPAPAGEEDAALADLFAGIFTGVVSFTSGLGGCAPRFRVGRFGSFSSTFSSSAVDVPADCAFDAPFEVAGAFDVAGVVAFGVETV